MGIPRKDFPKLRAELAKNVADPSRLCRPVLSRGPQARRPVQRTSARAPRPASRPSAPTGRPAPKASSDGDPPPPRAPADAPRAQAPAGATVLVSQATSLALLSLSRKRFIVLVRDRGIRHTVDRRLIIARLDDVLAALGLADAAQATPAPAWSPEMVLRAIRGGKAGAR